MRVICLCCQSSMNRRKCFSSIMRSIRASIIRWECNRLRLTVNPSSLWWRPIHGPGLGLLLAFTLFGKGMSKRSAPGAMIIHFLGGIHELYFPYVLMKPLTIIAMIAGGMSGTWVFNLLDGGLVAGPSPGSIFAYLALTPKGSFLATIAGVTVATLVSFAITVMTPTY